MIKKTIKYDDYNNNEVTEDFYFNLTKLEALELEIEFEGGLEAHLTKLTETTAGTEAYYLFKDILLKSYGIKSEDGKRFVKNQELRDEFEQSPAMAELIFDLLKDGAAAAEFVKGLLPARLMAEVEAEMAKNPNPELPAADPVLETSTPIVEKDPKDMTREELLAAMRAKSQPEVTPHP